MVISDTLALSSKRDRQGGGAAHSPTAAAELPSPRSLVPTGGSVGSRRERTTHPVVAAAGRSRGVRPAAAAEQRPPAAAPAAPVEEGEQQDEQLKVEQQQEQQGGVQVEQQVGEGASIAQHEAELQVERRGCRW